MDVVLLSWKDGLCVARVCILLDYIVVCMYVPSFECRGVHTFAASACVQFIVSVLVGVCVCVCFAVVAD